MLYLLNDPQVDPDDYRDPGVSAPVTALHIVVISTPPQPPSSSSPPQSPLGAARSSIQFGRAAWRRIASGT